MANEIPLGRKVAPEQEGFPARFFALDTSAEITGGFRNAGCAHFMAGGAHGRSKTQSCRGHYESADGRSGCQARIDSHRVHRYSPHGFCVGRNACCGQKQENVESVELSEGHLRGRSGFRSVSVSLVPMQEGLAISSATIITKYCRRDAGATI